MLRAMIVAWTLLASSMVWAQDVQDDGIKVKVQKDGDAVVVDLTTTIAASPQEVWVVLTDYGHMTEFLSNLQSSKILEKSGNVWRVEQKGQTAHGPISFAFDNVREVELKPFEMIRSHLISGSMKKLDGLTQLIPEGSATRLAYHSESISGVWVPPMIGTTIVEGEVRRQFQEMRTEILRRRGGKAAE